MSKEQNITTKLPPGTSQNILKSTISTQIITPKGYHPKPIPENLIPTITEQALISAELKDVNIIEEVHNLPEEISDISITKLDNESTNNIKDLGGRTIIHPLFVKRANNNENAGLEKQNSGHFAQRITKSATRNFQDFYLRITFRFEAFIKYMGFHILFYTLGPLGSLIIFFIDGSNSVFNMGFWGLTRTFLIQFINYCFLLFGILAYFLVGDMGLIDIGVAGFLTLLRCIIISCRYGYTGKTALKNYKSKTWNLNKREKEYLIQGWIFMKQELIDKEIMISLIRTQIELSSFKLAFVHKLKANWKLYLSKGICEKCTEDPMTPKSKYTFFMDEISQIEELNLKDSDTESTPCINSELMYSGRGIVSALMLLSKGVSSPAKYLIILGVASFINGLMPLLSRTYIETNSELTPFGYSYGVMQIIFTISMIILNTFSTFVSFMFLVFGIIDFKRRYFMNEILRNLVDKNIAYIPYFYKAGVCHKNIPFLNIFMPKTIYNWMNLKILLRDLGSKFLIRLNLYVEIFFFIYSSIFIFFCLVELNILQGLYITRTFWIIFTSHLIIVIGICFSYIWIGAANNYHYNQDIFFWNRHKSTLQNLRLNYNILSINPSTILEENCREGIIQFKELELTREEINEVLDECIIGCEHVIGRLANEQEINAFRMFGHQITYGFKQSIYMGFVSLLFLVAQSYFVI